MNTLELESAVSSLPSYEVWQEKSDDLARAAETKPASVHGGSSVAALEAQIEYLKRAEEIALPEAFATLRADIADARDDISLACRLGVLTVLDHPIDHDSLDIRSMDVKAALDDPSLPEICLPPEDRFERALRIGAVITETSAVISDDEQTPLLPFSLRRNPEDGSFEYTPDNLYVIKERRRGFIVSEPYVRRGEYRPAEVRYSLPQLRCFGAYHKTHGEIAASTSTDLYDTSIRVPELKLLEVGPVEQYISFYGKLLIGEAVAAYADEHWGKYLENRAA